MNLGIIDIYQNDPDKFIDDQKYIFQYVCWLLSEHEGTNIQKSITQISNAQLDRWSNSHVLTYITIFIYIRHVKYNVKLLN